MVDPGILVAYGIIYNMMAHAENYPFTNTVGAEYAPSYNESWFLDREQYSDPPPHEWEKHRLEFNHELQTPEEKALSKHDTYYTYHFNRDRYDPEANLITFFHPLGSSPSTRHGQRLLWQLRQRFPDNLIMAIGSEGTPDARVHDLDPDNLAHLRKQLIEDTHQEYLSDENVYTDIIGQSFGGLLAHEVAEYMHEDNQPVEHLALLSASFKSTRTMQFLSQLTRQEVRGVWRHRNTHELTQLGRYAIELTSRTASRFPLYYKLLRYITESEPDLNNISDETDIIVVGGEHDAIAYTDANEIPDTRIPDLRITVAHDAHSTFLIDSAFCGHVLETALHRHNTIS